MFVYGDIVRFKRFDDMINKKEILWIFIGAKVLEDDIVAVYFMKQPYFVAPEANKQLSLLLVSVLAFREQSDRRGNMFSEHNEDPEYFLSVEFIKNMLEHTRPFTDEGSYAEETSSLNEVKHCYIGQVDESQDDVAPNTSTPIITDKKKKSSKDKSNNNNTSVITSMSNTIKHRSAVLAQKKEQQQLATDKLLREREEQLQNNKKQRKLKQTIKISEQVEKNHKNDNKKAAPAFILFCNDMRTEVKKEMTFREKAALLGQLWRNLEPKQKVNK